MSAANVASQITSPTTNDSSEIVPYSSVTLAAIEVHPQDLPTSEDALPNESSKRLPRLSQPNLVVQPYFDEAPQLPPPRGGTQPPQDKWEMCYQNLTLREAVGWGKFGLVLLGVLLKGGHSQTVAQPVAASRSGQDHSRQRKLVAVKRIRGWVDQ